MWHGTYTLVLCICIVDQSSKASMGRIAGTLVLWGASIGGWDSDAERAVKVSLASIAQAASTSAVAIVAVAPHSSRRRRRRRRRLASGVAVSFEILAPARKESAKQVMGSIGGDGDGDASAVEIQIVWIILGGVGAAFVATVLSIGTAGLIVFFLVRRARLRRRSGGGGAVEFTRLPKGTTHSMRHTEEDGDATHEEDDEEDVATEEEEEHQREQQGQDRAEAQRPKPELSISVAALPQYRPENSEHTHGRTGRRGKDKRSPRSRRFSWDPRHWSGFFSPKKSTRHRRVVTDELQSGGEGGGRGE